MDNKCLDDELLDIYCQDGQTVLGSLRETYQKGRADEQKLILEKAYDLHASCCEEYGVDCFEAQSDAFGEFVVWLEKQIKGDTE